MRSPHAASVTRDSDITDTPYPVVTKSLLADHEKLEASHDPSQVNQPLFALIKARKALNDARLMCQYAKRFQDAEKTDRGEATAKRLSEIVLMLASIDFPITILENAKNHPRRHIMGGHESKSSFTPWGVE